MGIIRLKLCGIVVGYLAAVRCTLQYNLLAGSFAVATCNIAWARRSTHAFMSSFAFDVNIVSKAASGASQGFASESM